MYVWSYLYGWLWHRWGVYLGWQWWRTAWRWNNQCNPKTTTDRISSRYIIILSVCFCIHMTFPALWPSDWLTSGWIAFWLNCFLVDWLYGWLTFQLTDLSVDWLFSKTPTNLLLVPYRKLVSGLHLTVINSYCHLILQKTVHQLFGWDREVFRCLIVVLFCLLGKKINRVACGSAHSLAWSTNKPINAGHLPQVIPMEYNLLQVSPTHDSTYTPFSPHTNILLKVMWLECSWTQSV